MKFIKINLLLFFLILFNSCTNKVSKMNALETINIIPQPTLIKQKPGFLDLRLIKTILLNNNTDEELKCAELFQRYLSPINTLVTVTDNAIYNSIIINYNKELSIPKEGYQLQINKNNTIILEASSKTGLFYGFQSFRQICPEELENKNAPENIFLPLCEIKDSPKFKYRGMHLDVSRHFFDIGFIKEYIDMIAMHKMNVFHWHLTDDNGWRIEIKKYPELTQKSAWRVDRTNQAWKEQSPIKDGEKATYGGFYTQKEIKEIVSYASARNVMVIPEIEMPGHTSEVFAAYPELSCKGDTLPVQPGTYWPTVDIFCAGNNRVFDFIENVLSEVVELFPSPYIHIGGDEAEKTYWESCPKCQKRIKEENLKDEHELQSWFIKKVEKFILSKDKNLIGWDEILEGGIAKSATVMSWRGLDGGIQAANAGHDVIMCPTSHCYFDFYQASPNNSPVAFGGLVTLEKVYSFNPIPPELKTENKKYIIGAQGNLWTEYVQTPERAQYRVLPRMTALSEVLWSGPGQNSYEDFYLRLKHLKKRFDTLEWVSAPGSFTVKIKGELNLKNKSIEVLLSSEKPGEKIYFTTDGTKPDKTSRLYAKPFFINKPTKIIAAMLIENSFVKEYSEQIFIFHKAMGKKITYNTMYNNRYQGNGESTLIDGYKGSNNFSDGYWQGWKSEDLDVLIDLEKDTKINFISCGFLEAHHSLIFLPNMVEISFSNDGVIFSDILKKHIKDGIKNGETNRVESVFENIELSARFIKIKALSKKVCPSWHAGSGGHAWLFADEIIIE